MTTAPASERNGANTARVLVVDDSAFYRQSLVLMLKEIPGIEVIGVATDGLEAIQMVTKHRPSLITLDLEMPRMDGFGFLRWLMRTVPTSVLVVSAASAAANVFQALELGAADFIAKPTHLPSWEILKVRQDLEAKLRAILEASPTKLRERAARAATLRLSEHVPVRGETANLADRLRMVAIGSSTGGPAALQVVLTALPPDLPCAVSVAQHMPAGFTVSFAERLNRLSRWRVREAVSGEWCQAGECLVCPGGRHLSFERQGERVRVVVEDAGPDDRYIPSVDRLMESAAGVFGADATGVILTGMGHDGRRGMRVIKERGGGTIAESRETAVVFGMPHEAIQAGAVEVVAPLHEIAEQITKRLTASVRG
jgi:two-component system chemotaxis response regulator CheB